jgi:N-acetylmuramoyl-L-alanine amidase-like protein
MGGNRPPGPTCQVRRPVKVNDGTLCRQPSSGPGPLRLAFLSVANFIDRSTRETKEWMWEHEWTFRYGSAENSASRSFYDIPEYAEMIQVCLTLLSKVRFVTAHFQRPRKRGTKIDELVIHDTGSGQPHFEKSVRYLANPQDGRKVSIHYLIGREEGQIVAMVPEEKAANQATTHNDRSVGIELWKMEHDKADFTDWQYEAVAQLAYDIMLRHKIPKKNIIGHGSIDRSRRGEPHGFEWNRFYILLETLNDRVKQFDPRFAIF